MRELISIDLFFLALYLPNLFASEPVEKLDFVLSLTCVDFYRKSDRQKVYDYTILRSW
ncbi:MAG: hypothetical protein QHH14_09755 [Clostridiales bacterium]|nr:hypothetical protein [Clostridiales bacterium]